MPIIVSDPKSALTVMNPINHTQLSIIYKIFKTLKAMDQNSPRDSGVADIWWEKCELEEEGLRRAAPTE